MGLLANQTAEFTMICYSSLYLLIQVSFPPVPFITNFVMNLDVNLIKSFFIVLSYSTQSVLNCPGT